MNSRPAFGVGGHMLPVDAVLAVEHRHRARRVTGARHDPLPGIALLAAHELPRAVAGVVCRASVLPVVGVVADEVRMDARLPEQLGHRVIEGLQRPPAAVEEVVSARMHLAAGRHAWHRAGVEVLEEYRPLGQPPEIRSVDEGVRRVRLQHVPVEAVEHEDDGPHLWSSFM
jgi:hypothetical protein